MHDQDATQSNLCLRAYSKFLHNNIDSVILVTKRKDHRCEKLIVFDECVDHSGSNRHNALRDFVYQQAKSAQMNAEKEPLHLLQNCGAPADVILPNVLGGRSVCVDVAVTDPLQKKMVLLVPFLSLQMSTRK